MEPFIGQIILFAGNFAPRGWALCNGQLLDIASHTALFSILGTTYGGDGRTTFALPELRGRVPVHPGNGPGLIPITLGERAGSNNTTLTTANLPSHTHAATVTNGLRVGCFTDESDNPGDNPENQVLGPLDGIYHPSADASMGADSIVGSLSVTNSNTGNGTSFSNMQPFIGINYIIALIGIFPSRN